MWKHLILLAALAALTVAGCGGKETTAPEVQVVLTPDSTGVDLCGSLEISADVEHSEDARLDWYVNDVLGGNSTVGFVTQTNPATYSPPRVAPNPARVTVKAISRADPTKLAICVISLDLVPVTTLYVSAVTGSDSAGTGCPGQPFKSITHALGVATAGTTILVAPGIYDTANGETFPITLADSISLIGENWETTIIRGHDQLPTNYQSAVVFSGSQSALRKFTVEDGPVGERDWSVAIFVGQVSGARIDSIRMSEQARYSNIRLSTSTDAVVENCNFSATGNPVGRGLEIVFDDVGTVVRDCTLSGFYDGLFFNGTSNAKVETCVLQYNVEGVDLCCLESPGHNPNPDFGGGARSSLGGNIISENVIRGILNESYNTIYAKYNIWGHTPPMIGPATGSDIYSISTGSVIWE